MPLQIRRGPTADRLAITPLAGEIVFDTQTSSVYIGDGDTPGGLPVSAFSIDDARLTTARMFLGTSLTDNSQHSGITFQYVGDRLVATVSQDLTNYPGTIIAEGFIGNLFASDSTQILDAETGTLYGRLQGDLLGSVYSDDSTKLIDGVDGFINLDGTIKGNIIPSQNETYDIGSVFYKFKDIYLSGSTIYLGDSAIRAVGATIDLPAGSTVNGQPVGIEEGNTYLIDLQGNLLADDSSVIFNSATGIITATVQGNLIGPVVGNVEGNVTGHLIGSVFGDDSSILVDGTNSSINLNETIKGNAVPLDSETHNLGSFTKKFKTLYLTEGANLYIGNAVISSSSTTIDLPAGSTIGGSPIGGGGGGSGDVVGPGGATDNSIALFDGVTGKLLKSSTVTISGSTITASTLIANVTGSVTGDTTGNHFGNVVGDLKGSVVADDSTLLVDGTNGVLRGSLVGILNGNALGLRNGSPGYTVLDASTSTLDIDNIVANNVVASGNGFTGTLTGDVKGSVFADDSTVMVNAVDNVLSATRLTVADIENTSGSIRLISETGNISLRTPLGAVFIGTPSDNTDGDLYLNRTAYNDDLEKGLVFRTSQGFNPEIDGLNFLRSNGSSSASTAVVTNDVLGKLVFAGHDGTDFRKSVTLGVAVEGVSGANVTSAFYMTSKDSGGNDVYRFRALTDGRLAIGALLPTDTGSGALEIYNTSYIASNAGAGQPIIIKQYFDNTDSNNLTSIRNRGTRSAPSPVLPGDKLFEISVLGNATGSTAPISSRINFFTPSDGTIGAGKVPGLISLEVADYNGTVTAAVQVKADLKLHALYGVKGDVVGSVYADDSSVVIDATEGGKITAPSVTLSDFLQLPVFADDSARSTAIPTPAAGMVIFMQSGSTPAATNQIQFFNGSNWVSL